VLFQEVWNVVRVVVCGVGKGVFVGLFGCFIGVFVPCYADVAGDPN